MEGIDIPTASDQLIGRGSRLIHETNQCVLFDLLLSQDPSTRPESARASGLSRPVVITTLNEFVNAWLVVLLGNNVRDMGRPAKLYQVSPTATSVIAANIGRVWVRVAVVDIVGGRLYHHDVRNAAKSTTTLIELISAEVFQVKAKLLLGPRRTYAVIGSPSVFAPKRSVVDYVDQLLGWHYPKLINMLNDEFDTQLQIENDVNLAAFVESAHNQARHHESFAYFYIGTDAGLATTLNGGLHHDFRGAAGEPIYLLTATGVDGRARVLEDVISACALTASARELGLVSPMPKAVLQLAVAGDPTARQVMDQFVEGISVVVIAINVILDPERVVPSGDIGIRLQDYVAEISGTVTWRSPFHVDLEVTMLCTDVTLRGAVDMGLETARGTMFRLGVPDDLSRQTPNIS